MNVIYCGKSNTMPYYIKEADINIYSIQELAYFIYKYAILISNSFISKPLILYISKVLGHSKLASNINEMYNNDISLPDILTYILANSNYYGDEEIVSFRKDLIKLLALSEEKYINRAGDSLFYLGKYERAIIQYNKISKTDDVALLKLALCYAKLQFYENAAVHFKELYDRTESVDVLKQAYYCLKLNGTSDRIYDFERNIDENLLADWEFNYMKEMIEVRKSEDMKEMSDIFLMGSSYIKDNISNLIKIWKEKYRYIG